MTEKNEKLLDLYYHELRSHLLEAAATIDRFEKAGLNENARLQRLLQAAEAVLDNKKDRAKRFLEALSDE